MSHDQFRIARARISWFHAAKLLLHRYTRLRNRRVVVFNVRFVYSMEKIEAAIQSALQLLGFKSLKEHQK